MATKYVTGFKEFESLLNQLPKNIEERVLQSSTRQAATVMRKAVAQAAPISKGKQSPISAKFGHLKRNIKAKVSKIHKKRGQRGAYVTTQNAPQGFWYEFGTRFQSAKPWFRPAVVGSESAVLKKLADGIGKGIEREAVKLAKKAGVKV